MKWGLRLILTYRYVGTLIINYSTNSQPCTKDLQNIYGDKSNQIIFFNGMPCGMTVRRKMIIKIKKSFFTCKIMKENFFFHQLNIN